MEQNAELNKHINLIKKIPQEFFTGYRFIFNLIYNESDRHTKMVDIARLYYDLGRNMTNRKRTKTVSYNPRMHSYKFFDTIEQNYDYTYDYNLPRAYKGMLNHSEPLSAHIIVKPKPGQPYTKTNELRKQFIKLSRVRDITSFGSYINPVPKKFLDDCYNALIELLECADFEMSKPYREKGSQIITNELINFLSNKNIMLTGKNLIDYAAKSRETVIQKIKEHKLNMFGELHR